MRAPHAAPGAPHINLSGDLRAFYARRGMWSDGRPSGQLAAWLGEPVPWRAPMGSVSHWTTMEGLQAMAADAEAAPPQAWQSYHQKAQFLRRLRESSERAARGSWQAPSTPVRAAQALDGCAPSITPFEPLTCPPAGRAREAFIRHLASVTRDFVVYTQGQAYADTEGASSTP